MPKPPASRRDVVIKAAVISSHWKSGIKASIVSKPRALFVHLACGHAVVVKRKRVLLRGETIRCATCEGRGVTQPALPMFNLQAVK